MVEIFAGSWFGVIFQDYEKTFGLTKRGNMCYFSDRFNQVLRTRMEERKIMSFGIVLLWCHV